MSQLKKLTLEPEPVAPPIFTKAEAEIPIIAKPVVTAISPKKFPLPSIAVILLAVGLGIGSGYLLNLYFVKQTSTNSYSTTTTASGTSLKVGDVIGATDKTPFKDEAEGVLDKGGLDGEGSHKLLRPGGDSQTVYLTSSVIDLDALVGHKIHVWGETFTARKAGWLMDVGRAEVVELNAPKP